MVMRTCGAVLLLLIFGAFQGHAQTLPGPASGGWYVIMGNNLQESGTTKCFANVVGTRFKDVAYVEAEVVDNAEWQMKVDCVAPDASPTNEERAQLEKAQEACARAYDREKAALAARDADPKNHSNAGEYKAAQSAMWKACAFSGDITSKRVSRAHQMCRQAQGGLERAKQLSVTKRFGPYPTADRAVDELRAAGWRTGTSPTGNPIWQAESGC